LEAAVTSPTQQLPTSTHGGLGYAAPYRELTIYDHLFPALPAMPDPGMDVLQQIAAGMIDPENSSAGGGWPATSTGDNTAIPAGMTYLGQFIDHDLTFDPVSTLTGTEPGGLTDLRTARFDLDSLYGRGMDDEPYLYDQTSPGKLLLEPFPGESNAFDLPRNMQQRALIGDPRNDVHVIISQLHVLFARFHNARVAVHTATGMSGRDAFAAAQRDVVWHYQWLITHDYLDHIVGPELRARVLVDAVPAPAGQQGTPAHTELAHYQQRNPANEAWIPYEFSVAAFRFGHSQIRPSYRLNQTLGPLPIFDPSGNDLHGFRQRPGGWTIDWRLFYPIDPTVVPQASRLIDTRLAPSLNTLPPTVVTDNGPVTLTQRNLMRGIALKLPSGQAVAQHLGVTPYLGTLTDPTGASLTIPDPSPLWFYCLAEAQMNGGIRLGPVGGTIVAEVLVGILAADPDSWINQDPLWRPTLGATPGAFTMTDLIQVASTAT
jgi:hypothetical protein